MSFASGLLVALGTLLPWLVVVGLPLAVVLWLVRRARRQRGAAGGEPGPAPGEGVTPA